MPHIDDRPRISGGARRTRHARKSAERMSTAAAKVVRLLCLAGLLAALAGCDSTTLSATPTLAPTRVASLPTVIGPSASDTPEAGTLATSTPVAATSTPLAPTTQACAVPAVAGTLALSALPGAVRNSISLAANQGKIYVAGGGTHNIGVVQNDRLQAILPAARGLTSIAAGDSPGELFAFYREAQTIDHYVSERLQSTLALSRTQASGDGSLGDMLSDPVSHRLLVGVEGAHAAILVIDSRDFSVIDRIPFDLFPFVSRMALDAEHNRLWVTHGDRTQAHGDALSQIDIASHAVVQTIHLPGRSNRILVWDRPGGHLLVDAHDSYQSSGITDNLLIFEGGRLVGQIAIGPNPYGAAMLGRRLYMTDQYSSTLSVIDLDRNQLLTSIATGPAPRELVADPATQRLYLAPGGVNGQWINRLEVVDAQTNTLSGIIPLTGGADQLIADAARGRLYALLRSSKEVVVTDGRQVLARVPLERAPAQMALDDGSGRLFVTDSLARDVSIIDGATGRLVEHHPLDIATGPNALAVDRLHNRLLVNDRAYRLDSLTASGQYTLAGDAQTGNHNLPTILLVNPSMPRIYAIGSNGHPGSGGTDVLYLLDGDTLQQIAVAPSREVSAIVLDEAAQRIYAAAYPFAVYDARSLNPMASLDGVILVSAMALNPATHHLFLTHFDRFAPEPPVPTLEILDTRTLGQVLTMTLSSGPAAIALLGDHVFVAGQDEGSILVIRDCASAAPAAPTPTSTPAPYLTELPTPSATLAAAPTPTPVRKAPTPAATLSPLAVCRPPAADWFQQQLAQNGRLRAGLPTLGCPLAPPRSIQMVLQSFTAGLMIFRADNHVIYVLGNNQAWAVYSDTWDTSQPEGGTERPPSANLLAPKLGFGKVWREKLGGPSAAIGWATTIERSVTNELQDFEHGVAFKPDFDGVAALLGDGTWR